MILKIKKYNSEKFTSINNSFSIMLEVLNGVSIYIELFPSMNKNKKQTVSVCMSSYNYDCELISMDLIAEFKKELKDIKCIYFVNEIKDENTKEIKLKLKTYFPHLTKSRLKHLVVGTL